MIDPKEQVRQAVNCRLSTLQADPYLARRIIHMEKGEKRIMKKKLSVSIIAVLTVMVLSLSAAFAWVQSNIARQLYGEDPEVPEGIINAIQTPEAATGVNELGSVTLDEWLFDGHALHTSVSIQNNGNEVLLYTVDGMWLDDVPVWGNHMVMEGPGSAGLMLGGQVEGVAMPDSYTMYSKADMVGLFDENGKFRNYGAIPEGEMTLKLSVAVWRPIHMPRLVDYRDYEGANTTETADYLVTDETGYADLSLLRPDEYYREYNLQQSGVQAYRNAFRDMGWAELLGYVDLETHVDLNDSMIENVQPEKCEWEQKGLRLVIDEFSLTQAGGSMNGCVYGENAVMDKIAQNGFVLLDGSGKHILSDGCAWEQSKDTEGLSFDMRMNPFTEAVPEKVRLCPVLEIDGEWANADEKPENVIDIFRVDMENAFIIDLVSR